MEKNEIIKKAEDNIGWRISIKLKSSHLLPEITSHGYDKDSNNICDCDVGYNVDDIEYIKVVREANDDEMGALTRVGKVNNKKPISFEELYEKIRNKNIPSKEFKRLMEKQEQDEIKYNIEKNKKIEVEWKCVKCGSLLSLRKDNCRSCNSCDYPVKIQDLWKQDMLNCIYDMNEE